MLREHRILNAGLLARLASAGHTDVIVIADAGLPLPASVTLIDLSLVAGQPSFEQTVGIVLEALAVESAVVAQESHDSPVAATLKKLLANVPVERISHQQFKSLVHKAHVVVRTGECTPFANVALVAGVTF